MSQFIGKRYGEIIEESKNSSTGLIESTVVSNWSRNWFDRNVLWISNDWAGDRILIGGLDLLFAEKFDFSVFTLPLHVRVWVDSVLTAIHLFCYWYPGPVIAGHNFLFR